MKKKRKYSYIYTYIQLFVRASARVCLASDIYKYIYIYSYNKDLYEPVLVSDWHLIRPASVICALAERLRDWLKASLKLSEIRLYLQS